MFKNNYFKVFLVIGIALRIFLAMFTYHSDVPPFYFAGQVIKETGYANFYDFMPSLAGDHDYLKVYPRNIFNYPPAVYFTLGSIAIGTTSFFEQGFLDTFFFNISEVLGTAKLFILLLVLKLPLLIFDLGVLFYLRRMFNKETNKNIASFLWLFNPINLYATYMMGQFDIIPTFFVVLVVYNLSKARVVQSNLLKNAVLLGIGGAFKIFPLLLLVPLAAASKSWWTRMLVVATGFGTYLLTIAPFIASAGFRATALVANQTTKSLYAQIPLSGGETIMLFIALLIFLYVHFLINGKASNSVWQNFMLVLLLFFGLTHFHPQWLLWLTPLIVLELVYTKFKHALPFAVMFAAYLASLFFFDPGLTTRLFAPLYPNLFEAKGLFETLGIAVDYNFARSVLKSVFVGGLLFYFYLYLSPKQKNI